MKPSAEEKFREAFGTHIIGEFRNQFGEPFVVLFFKYGKRQFFQFAGSETDWEAYTLDIDKCQGIQEFLLDKDTELKPILDIIKKNYGKRISH